MSDIVVRLRVMAATGNTLCRDAADEIERLEAEVNRLEALIKPLRMETLRSSPPGRKG
jgi:hypothetical protein